MAGVDITSVVISAKSDGIDNLVKSLDRLTESAGKAEDATQGLEKATTSNNGTTKDSLAAVDKFIERIQRRADLLGASVAQQYAYDAALKGATVSETEMARAIGAEIDAYKRLSQEQSEAIRINKQIDASAKANKESADRFIQSLNEQAGRAGLTGQALKDYNAQLLETRAAQLGVSAQANPLIQKLKDTETAAGGAHGGVAGITRELLVLGHEGVSGNFSRIPGSLIVLGERLSGAESAAAGLSVAFGKLGKFITEILLGPVGLLIAAIGAAVAAISALKATSETFHEIGNALIITGNAAGATANNLNTFADSVGKASGNISGAREAVIGLAESGRFTEQQIKTITEAVVGLNTFGGKEIKDLTQDFIKLAGDPLANTAQSFHNVSKAALQLNQQWNFLDAETLQQIINQENLGNSYGASDIALKKLAETEKERTEQLKANASDFSKFAHEVEESWTSAWNAIFGRKSDQAELDSLKERLERLKKVGFFVDEDELGRVQDRIATLSTKIVKDQEDASKKQAQQAKNLAQTTATEYINSLLQKARGDQSYEREVERVNKAFDVLRKDDVNKSLATEENRQIALEEIRRRYATKTKTPRDTLAGADAELARIKAASEFEISNENNTVDELKNAYKKKLINVEEYVSGTEQALKRKGVIQEQDYIAEVEVLLRAGQQRNLSLAQREQIDQRIATLSKAYIKSVQDETKALQENSDVIPGIWQKQIEEDQKRSDTFVKNTGERTKLIQAEVEAYNNLPEAVKRAGVTEKQLADEITKARIAALQRQIDLENQEQLVNERKIDNYQKEINALNGLAGAQAQLEANRASNAVIQDYNKRWSEANKKIGDDLASAIIDGGGKGWKKLINDMKLAFAKLILQPILQPISSSFATLTTPGGAGSIVPGQSPNAAQGQLGQAIGFGQTLNNVYQAVSKGFAGLADSAGTAIANIGNFFGSESISGFGAGVANSGLGAQQAAGLYQAAGGSASGTAGAGLGANVGAAGTALAGAYAGIQAGHLISGGYGSNSAVNTGTAIGAAVGSIIPVLGTALGALIGGAVGGLVNRTFGHKAKEVTDEGIRGTISDTGVTGESFQDWIKKGGWFRSDIKGTDKQALGSDAQNSLISGFNQVKTVSIDLAKTLGVSADSLKGFSKDFSITLTNDAQKNQEAITKFFTGLGDEVATRLIPNIASFAKVGESASQTLERLSAVFKATDAIALSLGKTGEQAFGAVGLASDKARERLIDFAGGLDALNSQVQAYQNAFLTDAEKLAPAVKAISDAFAQIGVAVPKTKDQFRALVESLDLSTEAGAKEYAQLLALAPAFALVADAQKKVLDDIKNTAINTLKGAFDVLSKSVDAQKKSLQDAYDAQDKLYQAQEDAAKVAYEAQTSYTKAIIDTQKENVQRLQQLSDALGSTLSSLAGSIPGIGLTYKQATDVISDALKNTKGLTADSLKDALGVIAKPSELSYKTLVDYQKAVGVAAGKVADLKGITDAQKTTAEKSLEAAERLLDIQEAAYKQQIADIEAKRVDAKTLLDFQIQSLDKTLEYAQQQIDLLNENVIATKSVAEAIAGFNAALSGAAGGIAGAGGTVPSGVGPISTVPGGGLSGGDTGVGNIQFVKDLYKNILGRDPDSQGFYFYLDALINQGKPRNEIEQDFYNSPEYISAHGSHANGLDNVPFDGYTAKLHKGEMVLPATSAQKVRGDADNEAIIEAIKELMANNSAENQSMVSNILFLKRLFQNSSPQGDRIQVNSIGST